MRLIREGKLVAVLVLFLLSVGQALASKAASVSNKKPGIPRISEIAPFGLGDEEEEYIFIVSDNQEGEEKSVWVYDSEKRRILICSSEDLPLRRIRDGKVDEEEWIVIPDVVSPYTLPSTGSERSVIKLSYPQSVRRIISMDNTDLGQVEWIEFAHQGRHFFLPKALVVRSTEMPEDMDNPFPIGHEKVDRDNPLPLDYVPGDLVKLSQKWNFHRTDYPKYLRAEAAALVENMLSRAARENIHIRVFSAYRSSKRQRYLYLREIARSGWNQDGTAKPGHSEHQLGTTVDFCGTDPKTVLSSDFHRTIEGKWLIRHAEAFGFRQSYSLDNRFRTGYKPEPWHYRCVGLR